MCVWVLVHVSYLQTCLPACLGRGNHYAYYAYRHHEGKNPQHLFLCFLLWNCCWDPSRDSDTDWKPPLSSLKFLSLYWVHSWQDYKRDSSVLINTDCTDASENCLIIIASFSFVFPAKLNGLFNKLFNLNYKSALLKWISQNKSLKCNLTLFSCVINHWQLIEFTFNSSVHQL